MTPARVADDASLLVEHDGAVAHFALDEYVCLRSCLRESLTEGWTPGSARWAEAASVFHALPSASSRAATWAPETGWVALKGRGRWAPVEALAMLTWAAPLYREVLHLARALPWQGDEWLPRLTVPMSEVEALARRLDDLTRVR